MDLIQFKNIIFNTVGVIPVIRIIKDGFYSYLLITTDSSYLTKSNLLDIKTELGLNNIWCQVQQYGNLFCNDYSLRVLIS